MGDAARCGSCGYGFCDCTDPIELPSSFVMYGLCGRCFGCMATCEGKEISKQGQTKSLWASCGFCRSEGDLDLPEIGISDSPGMLACPHCGHLLTKVDVTAWSIGLETTACWYERDRLIGTLRTRRQSYLHSDLQISRDGLAAEMAACLILCPQRLPFWTRHHGPNRGNDLQQRWTGLDKPVEVKHTRYQDFSRGYLLIRPPRWTPGPMRKEYIDDSYYVLMCGRPYTFEAVGWADKSLVLEHGQLDPVPVRRGQRHCWGLHWSKLLSMEELAERVHSHDDPAAIR